jgi:hypothetical protein
MNGRNPVSLRLPDDLWEHIERRRAEGGNRNGYICDLIRADMRKKPRQNPEQARTQRQLAEIHAAIISCGNQIVDAGRATRDETVRADLAAGIEALRLLTSAVVGLQDKRRGL